MGWPKDTLTPSVCPPPMKGPTPNTGEPTQSIESEILSPVKSKKSELRRKRRLHNTGRPGTELRAVFVTAFTCQSPTFTPAHCRLKNQPIIIK